MSKKVLVNLNMSKNQIENAAAHNLSSAPSNPAVGQEYFNTSDKQKYIWNGTEWISETSQGRAYNAGAGIDSSALTNGTIQVSTTVASKTDIGDGTLTVQRNGASIGSFKANATSPSTINISVPTTATEVGALPSTTTITDLVSATQMDAINSGATTINIGQIATNTSGIAAINSLIPSGTTASNQLADKAFVNSSIATSTATFRGTFNSVAALEAYSGEKDDNDYAFVTGTDSDGNAYYDRYKYNGTAWVFEYRLNNSSFTSTQWAAINSGVTASTVSAVAANTSAIAGKQDALIAGSNITITNNTISATNTTYSNGSGLSLTGTTFAVDFTAVATAAQGAKADTAVQVYSESNPALTQSGGLCTWTVTHNLGTRNVEVKVYEISSWEEVVTSVALTSTNAVTVKLNSISNITASTYQVVVAGH